MCMFSGECFLEICPNNVRDMKTLNRLILKRVKPNTTIFTDGSVNGGARISVSV
jgi:hypothetical protein